MVVKNIGLIKQINKELYMQITFNPSFKTFKGSFPQVNLDDLLPECDNWQKNNEPHQVLSVPDKISRKLTMKTIVTAEDGIRTNTTLWEAEKSEIKNYIPKHIKDLCKSYGIDPVQDLFMVSGTNENGELFVVFNSFFRHEEVFEIPKKNKPEEKEKITRFVDCEQVYCMKSTNDNATPLQMDLVKVFNDPFAKKYFLDASTKNPLKTICDPGVKATEVFVPALHALAAVSKDKPLDELVDENGKINRVVYTADGKYARYKIIYLPLGKFFTIE